MGSREYLKISIELKPGTSAWYGKKAIKANGVPQAEALRESFGAIFGAVGAALEGEPEKMESLIRKGQFYFDSWASVARNYCSENLQQAKSVPTVQVTRLPERQTLSEEDEDFDDQDFDLDDGDV